MLLAEMLLLVSLWWIYIFTVALLFVAANANMEYATSWHDGYEAGYEEGIRMCRIEMAEEKFGMNV